MFNKDWNTYKTNWENANGFFGKIGSVFTPANAITKSDIDAIKAYNAQIDACATSQTAFNRTMLNASPAAQNLVASYNGGKVSAQGMATAQNMAKTSTVGLTIAQTALNAAIGMGVGLLINLVVQGVNKLIHANEEAIESAKKLREEYEEFKSTNASNINTLKGLEEEFNELSKGVSQYGDNLSLTTEQYERYKEIVQQIVGMSPELAEGYSTENGYIADKNGLLERAIELQEIEYRNELRKITNLESLKTSMSGYIAEYKKALNGGIITAEGNIVGTTIDTDFKNSLWQLYNTNNRKDFDAQDMAKDIMESLGVEDVDKEIQKYFNEHGYWQESSFWNDYCDIIINNLNAVTDSLSYEEVGLDETTFDQNLEKLESYAESYADMKDSVEMANEAIQTDLGYIAEYADGYSALTTEQQKFVADFLKGYNILDIASETSIGLKYDNDKMASVKNEIKKFVEELSQDETTKKALSDLYAIPTDEQSIGEFVNQFRNALEVIEKYCSENGIEIPIAISDSEKTVNELEAQYQRVVDFTKKKFNGYDPTVFFEEHSINTQEEIDKWLEIAQSVNSATEAEREYLEGLSGSSKTDNLFSYDKLEDIPQKLSEIESAYQTAQEALDSFNEKGYYSMDVIDSILSLEDEYINILVDENGQLQINSDSMDQLAAIKIEAAKASIYQETCEELVRIKTLDTSLAAQELALVNGTLTESAYETAKALYEEVTAMGGANAALADNVWNAATKKVKLLDNQLASIQGKTYSVDVSLKATSSSSSSTSSDPLKDAFTQEYNTLKHNLEMDYITEKQYYDSLAALNRKYFAGKEEYLDEYRQYEEEVYKGLKSYYTDYAESQMDLLESQLDAGIINYAHYSSTIKSLLDNMYADSRLSAEDYHKYIQQMLNKQLDIYDKVLSAVTSRIEKEIDGIEDIIDSIEKQNDTLENQLDNYDSILSVIDSVYEAEIDRIKAEQDAIQENIDALQDENDQRELALKLEEARWALYKAQNQRTKKIFNGTEFVYETDQAAVREAQETLADLELEQVVDGLEREKDALDDTISELEKYRELWAEITDTYEKEANEQLIIALYGKDYQKIILRNQLSDIEAFKNNYVSIQNQINDNEGLIASYKEKTEYYEALKQQWSDISDAYENSMESQYAAMILGQNWESDVLNGRLDTLNRFKNQYISLQQQIADAAIAANNAIAASNEAVKNSQISSSVSAGNSVSGSSASDSPTSNNLNSSSSGSSNSPALWRIVDYSSGATLKTGLKTAAEVSSWCSANGYTIVSENANTRIAAAKKQTAAATTTTAIQKAKAPATKHYASGTTNAKRGLNLVGEAGTETYIDNDGNVSLVTKPALIPMEGGETVIKASETEKILSNMGNTVPSDSNEVLNKILSELPPFNEEEFRQRVMSITPSYSSMVQIPDMFTPNYDFEAVNRDNSVKVEIGDIHLHQVQKVDTLANEIIRELPNKVLQRLGKK